MQEECHCLCFAKTEAATILKYFDFQSFNVLSLTFICQRFIFSQHFSANSTDSTDTFLTRMKRYIHSVICKLNNIVWSSQVQINPYTSRSFLDHVSSDSVSPPSFLPPALPWLVSSHISVSHFSSYVSSCLQHTVSWPSSMASTHWEHRFVCWSKRACFEPCTWSQSMMMSVSPLSSALKDGYHTQPLPLLFGFVVFHLTPTIIATAVILLHTFCQRFEICVQHAGLHGLGFFVNSDNPTIEPHVSVSLAQMDKRGSWKWVVNSHIDRLCLSISEVPFWHF